MKGPQIWLAVLRIVVGAWFLKAVWTKLTVEFAWGVVPYLAASPRFLGFQPKRVVEFANGNPVTWYKQFLEGTVLPHARLFAHLQAYGEAAVGLALLLGFCVGLAALIGLFLALNYGLATQWMSFGQQGFHVLLITAMIIFLGARAGRVGGLDGLILRKVSPSRRRWLSIIMVFTIFLLLPLSAGTASAAYPSHFSHQALHPRDVGLPVVCWQRHPILFHGRIPFLGAMRMATTP
jgi:thiosulfate dehydrogenase [quinone] large subunit